MLAEDNGVHDEDNGVNADDDGLHADDDGVPALLGSRAKGAKCKNPVVSI